MKRALAPCEKWVFRGFSRHANGLYGPEMDMGAGGGGGGRGGRREGGGGDGEIENDLQHSSGLTPAPGLHHRSIQVILQPSYFFLFKGTVRPFGIDWKLCNVHVWIGLRRVNHALYVVALFIKNKMSSKFYNVQHKTLLLIHYLLRRTVKSLNL